MRFGAGGSRFRRGVAIATGLITVGGLVVFAAGAGAAPQPTVDQVQARINQLTSQFDQVSEQFDQASQQLSAAQSRLSQVRVRLGHANAQFQAAQANMAQTAAAAFEDTGATSVAGVLTSGDPSVVLQQGSLLMELSGSRNAQTKQLLTDASQLAGVEQVMQRTESGIATLKSQLADHKNSLGRLISTEKATLNGLTVPQQQTVQSNSIGGNGSSAPQPYTGPASTQAGKAVAFAYAQLGKPYQWGAAGPGSFDCSGLAQAAWSAAGMAIPRDTYEQWASLPHIATSAIQPGDLLYYDGEGHVAMYVGDGYIIDAPQTGMNVQKLPMNTSWYASTFDGAVRP
jgi:peptidoglycan DL-endopeptidase CwlO